MKAYGANPTPIPYGQLYTALQQGVVDGNAATPIVPAASIKLYEVIKNYTAIGFRINLLPIYINQKKFDSLTPSQQKAILDAAAQVKPLAGQWAKDKVKSAIADFTKAGVPIYHPNKEEMAKWLAVRETLWKQIADEFKGKIDLGIANDLYKLRAQ
jgi:TRAP-type C4-dicarboxylate transport system substrate-binding protein